jgi:hypothetical protein
MKSDSECSIFNVAKEPVYEKIGLCRKGSFLRRFSIIPKTGFLRQVVNSRLDFGEECRHGRLLNERKAEISKVFSLLILRLSRIRL